MKKNINNIKITKKDPRVNLRPSLRSACKSASGFTLIEILISTAIALVLTAVAVSNLVGFRTEKKLDNTATSIVALLRTAQEKSVNQEGGVGWGVSFNNSSTTKDSFELFQVNETLLASSSYTGVPGTSTDKQAIFSGIELDTPEMGERLNVAFDKFSGQLDAAETIVINSSANSSNQRT
ncbi:MAG: prepilin-type N-terminal cleavage/methylation domain-containing protein, partial [bacterium]|nr:prepilin-type N-terminal cleavage/methylation domain-containing protein [bacterium]